MRVRFPPGLPAPPREACLPRPCLLTAQAARFSPGQCGFDSRQGRRSFANVVFNSSTRPCHGRSTGASPVIRSGRRAFSVPFRRAVPDPVVQWLTTAGCLPANAGSIPVGIAVSASPLVPWSNGSRLPVVSRPIRVRFPSGSLVSPLMALSSNGTGSRPFTPRTRVRFPSGLPVYLAAGVM